MLDSDASANKPPRKKKQDSPGSLRIMREEEAGRAVLVRDVYDTLDVSRRIALAREREANKPP